MRFWIQNNGVADFYYADESDDEVCERCLEEVVVGRCYKRRYALRYQRQDGVYIFCHPKEVVAKQAKFVSKLATSTFNLIAKAARRKSEGINEISTIAYHNAKKMNASIGQKIDKVFPEMAASSFGEKIERIEAVIRRSTNAVAREIVGIRKTVEQIESEYNLIEVINLDEPFDDTHLNPIKIHKLLVSAFYLYQEDFHRRRIFVDIKDTDRIVKVDYGVAKSAIGQIFNNATKYCQDESRIDVTVVENDPYVEVHFSMTSLQFNESDVPKLMSLGGRGDQALETKGDGVGLFAVRNYMRMHRGYFKMASSSDFTVTSGNRKYAENVFTLGFYKY